MPPAAEHTVKSYDTELTALSTSIAQMGGLAEAQLSAAITAMARRDTDLATRTIEADARVDALERQVEEQCVRMLALRQPMAQDLRRIVSSLRIANDLERVADYAANIAKRSIALSQAPVARPSYAIPRMGRVVQGQIKDCLDAFLRDDQNLARQVIEQDAEVDEMYNSLFRELLTYMMEDPRWITLGAHLLFIAKNIERIGDHATNIAEQVHYSVTGENASDDRAKSDQTPYLTAAAVQDGGSHEPE
ncbi:MAG: phosphate signaling complex protein PhoU [Sneathiellaceae bacterium]